MTPSSRTRRGRSGQSLVEYALLLALVAVVAATILFGIGLSVQRVYGVIAAVLGAKHDTTGSSNTIVIDTALCVSVAATGKTGLWVTGTTNEPLANLIASTERVGQGPVSAGGSGFVYNPEIASVADTNLCPKAVVVQSRTGAIAITPLTVVKM